MLGSKYTEEKLAVIVCQSFSPFCHCLPQIARRQRGGSVRSACKTDRQKIHMQRQIPLQTQIQQLFISIGIDCYIIQMYNYE